MGGKEGQHKCDHKGSSGEWASAKSLAEYLHEKEHKIINAAGRPEDGNHRFRFYVNDKDEVFIQAKNRNERGTDPEI